MKKIDRIISNLKEYSNLKDKKKVLEAWEFTKNAHKGQKRLSGEPYSYHGLEVALKLSEWKLDETSVIAGFLHDTVEDAGVTLDTIEKLFGKDVSYIVSGVTKVSGIKLRGSEEDVFVENLRKMFIAMAKDIRVVLVKLADRTHNMETLYALPKVKSIRIAKETLEVYAPLAERLGMGLIKGYLEDLAFPYLYPKEYRKFKKESKAYYKKAELDIKNIKHKLYRDLYDAKVEVKIHARKKHFYSLYKKLQRQDIKWDWSKIKDVVALRIIAKNTADCYTALGIVHNIYKHVPNGVSDFIAQPKPNGYQSIHTKIFSPSGRICEVQIRTEKMHAEAEYGIAAHWTYSELKNQGKVRDEKLDRKELFTSPKLGWVSELVKWQDEITDSKEYLNAVKLDILSHRIYVFSPKGDVYDLPNGATPIDFAFAVHTDLGLYISIVKVNGKVVPLSYNLQNGDIIEILKSKNKKKPSSDWFGMVKTATARRMIRKALS